MKRSTTSVFLIFMLLFCMGVVAKERVKEKGIESEETTSPLKKYEEVITKEAKTFRGLFTVHMVEEKLYYEIPLVAMEYTFLWVSQLSKAATGAGYSGDPLGNRVVRWERRGNNVLLREIKYKLHAREGAPEAIAVKASSLPTVIGAYKIVCFNSDRAPVIDVTELFTGDVPEFSPKEMLGATNIDKNRTFIDSVKVFPFNIETRVLATYTPKPPKDKEVKDEQVQSISVELHHSMVKLPDEPMMARIRDKRVGYFGHSFEDYSGSDQQKVDKVNVIHRFRLEKKDPTASLSEPVQPIVFYVGREVPEKYKPYIKQAIEDWKGAFEQAGFKNAIVGKYAPGEAEAPDWDAEDARYSVIRWMPSTTKNAMGPHVADPRSGEILEADVLIYHNVLDLARQWYYVQASPNDPEAQTLPFSDPLMGKVIRYVVAHEVGHSLGLRHNFKASSQVTIAQIRDPQFTALNGYIPSIMDYARFNYIAQPGDGAALIPAIGPYDRFAIEWGYKLFRGIKNPEEEKPLLNEIAARQLTNPLLRYGSGREGGVISGADYTAQTEDLGNDAIVASTLGLKNLERVMGYMVAGTTKAGGDYEELRDIYKTLLLQFSQEMGHVANMVGGIEIHNKVFGMEGDVYTPLDTAKQRQAIAFLSKNCFASPPFLLHQEVIHCLGMHTIAKQIGDVQKLVLLTLLNSGRASRIGDIEAAGYPTYPVIQLVGDLTDGIFTELSKKDQTIGILRRNVQATLVRLLVGNLSSKNIDGDLQAASRFHLLRLEKKLQKYSSHDDVTSSHVLNLRQEITAALKNDKK